MGRTSLLLREVAPDDAPALAELWQDVLGEEHDLPAVIARVSASDDDRIVVAESSGRVAGAVFLRIAPVSPLHTEPMVHALSPHVLPEFRRHGIGRALMEAAVSYAEERGVAHVAGASVTASRDGNRFLARLAMAPQAVVRVAPTHAIRAKLIAQRPRMAPQPAGRPTLGRVLAQRRSLRRQRELV